MVLVLPLSLKRNLSSLNYVSLFGIVAIFYIMMVIIIEMPYYVTSYWSVKKLSPSDIVYIKVDANLLISFTVNLLSYTCCQIVFELRDELSKPTIKRTFKVLDRSIFIETALYILIGLFGYMSSLSNTPQVLLTREGISVGKKDYFMIIASLAMTFSMICSIPMLTNPGRATFSSLIYKKEYYNKITHFIFTLFFLIVPSIIAIFMPKIITAMSFLGGTCSILIGVTFPSIFLLFYY